MRRPLRLARPLARVVLFATLATANLVAPRVTFSQALTWTRWAVPAGPIQEHVAVYDPGHRRLVVLGGTGPGPDSPTYNSDVWTLDLTGPGALSQWDLHGSGGEGYRHSTGVVDPAGNRVVLFGGETLFGEHNGTLQYSLTTEQFTTGFTTGTPPPAGYGYASAFDSMRRRMLVFGRHGESAATVYALDLATNAWSTLATAGTAPTFAAGSFDHEGYPAVYDEPRDRLVVVASDGPYELTLAGTPTWSAIATAGSPPFGFDGHLSLDAARDRVVFVRREGSVYALSLTGTPTWTLLAGPLFFGGPQYYPRIVHDPAHDRLLFFGRFGANDTKAFALETGTWSTYQAGTPLTVPYLHSAVAVPGWDAMLVFGGFGGPGTGVNGSSTAIRFPFSGNAAPQVLTPSGTAPSPRRNHAAIYDPIRNRMIIFGGNDGGLRNDLRVLLLANTSWNALFPPGTLPAAREGASAVYDPVRDRLVLFSGRNASGWFVDTWTLSLTGTPTWTQLSAGADLPALNETHAVYDSRRDRLVVVGADGSHERAFWAPLAGPIAWTEFDTGLTPLGETAAAYDSAGDRVLVYGGVDEGGINVQGTLWQLSTSTGAWSPASVSGQPPRRYRHTLVRDPLRERFLLYGGLETGPVLTEFSYGRASWTTWFLSAPYTLGVERGGAPLAFTRLVLAARDRLAFEITLDGPEPAILEVFDVAGRRLGRGEFVPTEGARTSGQVVLARAAEPGLCFVRLRQGRATALGRVLVLR